MNLGKYAAPGSEPAAETLQGNPMDYSQKLDDLLGQLSKPRQDFSPPPSPGSPLPGSDKSTQFLPGEEFHSEPINPEEAKRSGRRMAVAVDGALSFSAALIAKSDNSDEYRGDSGDIDDLGNAFAEISQDYNIKFPPWIMILFLIATIYGPKFKKAFNDRRFNIIQEELKELRETSVKIKAEIEAMKEQK